MSYLLEATVGNYLNRGEDRLSQIFSASFNASFEFRKIFLKMIKSNCPAKDLISKTQQSFSKAIGKDRIDILIEQRTRYKDIPRIIIENKTDAELTEAQLMKYNNIEELKKCKRIAITKHYYQSFENIGWDNYYWTNMYQHIIEWHRKNKTKEAKTDGFIIDNFKRYLEDNKMANVSSIKKIEFKKLAEAMYKLREDNKPHFTLKDYQIFETASNYLSVLEDTISELHNNRVIMKKLDRNVRFSPIIAWWIEEDEQEKAFPFLGVEMYLNNKVKYRGNKLYSIGTGIHFNNSAKGNYAIESYISDKDGDYIREHFHSFTKELNCEKYKKEVLANWEKWLK